MTSLLADFERGVAVDRLLHPAAVAIIVGEGGGAPLGDAGGPIFAVITETAPCTVNHISVSILAVGVTSCVCPACGRMLDASLAL
jgi:hypothetical protein